ncbi:hypothetical protein HDU98_001418 [Podochytrium sp. JEL0797]|nr:hypothetical protein HDU98_001418 [Podochytrium sp. JEL0797]
MSFENRYRWRKTDKAGTCWVCHKESPNVFVVGDNVDWFYLCESHIRDKTFCAEILPPAVAPVPTPAAAASTNDASPPDAPAKEEKKSTSLLSMFDSSGNLVKPSSPPLQSPPQATPAVTGPRFFQLDGRILFLRQNEKKQKEDKRQKGRNNQSALRDLERISVPKNALS